MTPTVGEAGAQGRPIGFKILGGVLPIRPREALRDAFAGVTLASMNIPQVLGYTRIAGTPVVTGLYTVLLPLIAFAVFGSSRHLVVAADSATAAIFSGALSHMAPVGGDRYMALVGMLTLETAALLLLARLLKAGFLADFLSRTVLVGFLTGVGVQVGVAMLGDMLGVAVASRHTVVQLWEVVRAAPSADGRVVALSIFVAASILLARRFAPRFPAPLVLVVGSIAASAWLNLAERGVAVIANQPLERGDLFRRVRRHALPDWAREFDCATWAELFLKYVLAESAMTCVIPATGNPDHMNVRLGKAGRSRWLGRRPHVRGVAMNPVAHPMGGGEGRTSGGRHPCSPTGVLAKGGKTRRRRKPSNKAIIRRRRSVRRPLSALSDPAGAGPEGRHAGDDGAGPQQDHRTDRRGHDGARPRRPGEPRQLIRSLRNGGAAEGAGAGGGWEGQSIRSSRHYKPRSRITPVHNWGSD